MTIQAFFISTRVKKNLLLIILIVFLSDATAQQTPLTPVSNRVFTPFILNPAIAGSKDFVSVDFAAVIQGSDNSQILSGNARLSRKGPDYFGAPVSKKYTRVGLGGSVFNDVVGTSRNIGFSAVASYHIPLDINNTSFVSGGIGIKAMYNHVEILPDIPSPENDCFIPNVDAGLYYYGQKFSAGVSATNILGLLIDSLDAEVFDIPVSRQYFLVAGYKFLLSRSLNIVLEPTLIVCVDDSLAFGSKETYNPMLKLYMEDFCFGTYLHDYDKLTFFFEYKFPRFYLGTLVDFPRNAPFFKQELVVELAFGVNFGNGKFAPQGKWHW